ncbi:MAG: molybdopterin cofactor-binding domain-containing protein [Thermoanaerobaculia bacterium]|nr:molybdopterin cofactor-binding domain-containing protein [Thermoanaerobaculia bacterium]
MRTTRRSFVKLAGAGSAALILGVRLGSAEELEAVTSFEPNAWLRIDTDGRVLLTVGKSEMGQGVRTSLPMILAEELDADFDDVVIEQASPGPDFDRLGTGGSGSIMRSWDPLRQAGAAARMMLVAAAANRWDVSPESCRTAKSHVLHPATKRELSYGSLVAAAANRPVPDPVILKSRDQFTLLGTSKKRLDGLDIVTGKATYGFDVRQPEMLFAVVTRSPVIGGKVKSFDASATKKVRGVRHVIEIPTGIAVVADDTWAALKGRDQLSIEWSESPHASFDTDEHMAALAKATEEPGITIRKDGEGRVGFPADAKRIESLFLYPFAAHASVEPVNSTVFVKDGSCEIWSPTQTPNTVHWAASQILGIDSANVRVNVMLLGGGFGRRLGTDFDQEAIHVAKQIPGTPVQLVWTRQDDIRYGYFQAASAHRLIGVMDEMGRVVGIEHRKVSTPHNARGRSLSEEQKVDPDTVRGSAWGVYDSPYGVRNAEMTYRVVDAPVSIGPWRSVFSPSSVFARESFIDELAVEMKKDPFVLRHELLGAGNPDLPATYTIEGDTVDRPRLRKLLDVLENASNWNAELPDGHARGMAANFYHTETYIGYVVEVRLREKARSDQLPFIVDRVVCAIDCGVVVNPNGVEQQVESGVLWSLSNMKGQMTWRGGTPQESNYLDFPVAMIEDTPRRIEVKIVEGDDPRPHGIGEPVVDPIAPAVANALFRLTGKRYRKLPLTDL